MNFQYELQPCIYVPKRVISWLYCLGETVGVLIFAEMIHILFLTFPNHFSLAEFTSRKCIVQFIS